MWSQGKEQNTSRKAESFQYFKPYTCEKYPHGEPIARKMLGGPVKEFRKERSSNLGERALQNRIMKLKELEAQQEQIEKEAEKIRQEIKAGHGRKAGGGAGSGGLYHQMESRDQQPV